MAKENKIDQDVVKELEASKNEVLRRIAEKLKTQLDSGCVSAAHSSHSSGSGRGHSSYTNH